MALPIPTDRRFDAVGLEVLVRAVAAATPDEPETDALEWKGALDLSSRKARFDLARHLLGFGNRSVPQSQRRFEGFAYLLAGVAPCDLCGITLPDPAELHNALDAFVAHGHPHWQLHRVTVDDTTVGVIEIAPPRDGDRICCLQDRYDNAHAGRIYVRRQGQTIEAGPGDIRALEDRHAAGATALQQEVHALAKARDESDRIERAERDAPDFVSGRLSEGFVYVPPSTADGVVRNRGATAATITDARLHTPTGAYPGAAVALYPSGADGAFSLPTRIDKGINALMRFVHPNLAGLEREENALLLELYFTDDAGLRWLQTIPLRRHNTDRQGRRLWTVREPESERQRLG
jgi:hypothetical protein